MNYIYCQIINYIDVSVIYAEWYSAQALHGHVEKTRSGLAYGQAQGTLKEIQGLQEYATLDKFPDCIRLAISKQKYGNGEHWLLIFKDSQGVWLNLDHVYSNRQANEWHGNPTNPESVKMLWCMPTMTADTQPASTPNLPQPPVLPSPQVQVTPEEQRLQQCFQQIPTPHGETLDESRNVSPSP